MAYALNWHNYVQVHMYMRVCVCDSTNILSSVPCCMDLFQLLRQLLLVHHTKLRAAGYFVLLQSLLWF